MQKKNIIIEHDVVIPMRDGTRLLADVMRPDDDLPRPVVLSRSIYDKSAIGGGIFLDPMAFARAGYVFVVQDCRGTFASEGNWEFFYQERDDGYDTVEWVAKQPWSSGKVGIIGASGTAMVAFQAVAAQPPSLSAAFVGVGAADMKTWLKRGGSLNDYALNQSYLSFFIGTQILARLEMSPAEKAELQQSLMQAATATNKDLMKLPIYDYEALLDKRITGGFRDVLLAEVTDSFWKREAKTLGGNPSLAKTPVMMIAGIHDMFLNSMLNVFKGAPPGIPHEIVIGPWAHFGAYGLSYGTKHHVAAPGGGAVLSPKAVKWFDSWMKSDNEETAGPSLLEKVAARGGAPSPSAVLERGIGTGQSDRKRSPRAYYFLSGENRWTMSPTWPPEGKKLDLFLSSDNDAVLFKAPSKPGVRKYTYDPANPVPTMGGAVIDISASFNMTFDPSLTCDGVQDQRRIESRPDILVYTSPELKEVVRIAGPVTARIFVSSSAEDTDFFVRLIDVEPDGFAGNVSEGVTRARYREGRNDSWLTPDKTIELVVELHDTAHSFQPGHRIRVDVTSSCFPKYSRNLNSRVVPELGHDSDIVVAHQRVFDGGDTQSRITLHTVAESEPASPYM